MTNLSITANDVTHTFTDAGTTHHVLKSVSFAVREGEFVSIVGPSGCGKTTLLTLIGGLRRLQQGSLTVLGQPLHSCSDTALNRLRQQIGIVFQAHHLMEFLTAKQNVQVATESFITSSFRRREELAIRLLDSVGLSSKLNSYPSMLSGGQKQRVAFARALACQPKLVLADEPTASLDRQTGHDVVSILREIAKEKSIAVVMATHDARVIDVADRIVEIDDGVIVRNPFPN